MAGKFEASKKQKKTSPLLWCGIAIVLAAVCGIAALTLRSESQPAVPEVTETVPTETEAATQPETTVPETTQPEPVHPIATATVGAMGDLLMHKPIIDQSRVSGDEFDFSHIFRYIREDISALDCAVANLETTLCSSKPYSGYPLFNCPDQIAVDAKDAGFDVLLTANNHSYDTGIDGYRRTLEVTRELGFETLGTMLSGSEPRYIIRDINGIRVGMICYTYETNDGSGDHPALNGNQMYDAGYDMINCFSQKNLPAFYEEIGGYLEEMRTEGAEVTIVFIHWGVEYLTYANDTQKAMAQQLCDLGADVIVGGHPHVLEPVTMLESSEDPSHQTLCVYSLGNAVSNYRRETSNNPAAAGYTEDGALFTVTFEKYSDGSVYVLDTDVLPTWVNVHSDGAHAVFPILPLKESTRDSWQTMFGLSDSTLSRVVQSYERTQNIVGEGLADCRSRLAQQKEARDRMYTGE